MYLNSSLKNYEKKYKKYKNKYQMLKSQLNGALLNGGAKGTLLNGGAKGTLLNGGDCDPLPYPEDESIINGENLLDLCPEQRITINNKCYEVNELYNWIVVLNKSKIPGIEKEITPGDRQRLIQAYNALPPHFKKSFLSPAPDFFESDDEDFGWYLVSDDYDDDWHIHPQPPGPPPPPLQYNLHDYCRRYISYTPINEITNIDNNGDSNIDMLIINKNWLQGFDNLRTIYLRYDSLSVQFSRNDGDDIITSNTLETFVLQTNLMSNLVNLDTIWPRMFVNLNSIKSIDLSFNMIANVYRDSFVNLPVLTELNLSYNQISVVPRDLFQNLPTLEKINLSYNKISNLPEDLLQNLSNLTKIDLSNNQISIIPNIFKNLRKLTYISLGYNQITTIYANTFINLPASNMIGLVGNRITTIQPHSFVNLNRKVMVVLMTSTISEYNKRNIGYAHM
jgi:hypothetical protein